MGFLIYVPCQAWMSMEAQVLYPQILSLAIMASGAWLSLALWLGGNAVALVTLGSQVLIGLTNATITGGVYAMAAWLPPLYLQVGEASLLDATHHDGIALVLQGCSEIYLHAYSSMDMPACILLCAASAP